MPNDIEPIEPFPILDEYCPNSAIDGMTVKCLPDMFGWATFDAITEGRPEPKVKVKVYATAFDELLAKRRLAN